MKILHIISSPRGLESKSATLTNALVETCRSADPKITVDLVDVWNENLPDFDREAIGAKYKAVCHTKMTGKEEMTWDRIQSLIKRFQAADRIVVGVPMWNFSIPYKLKQLIDLVHQRNFLFTYDGKQYGPALQLAKGVIVYTRGSSFREGTPLPPSRFDYQATYMDFLLRLIGVQDLRSVFVEGAWNQDDNDTALSVKAAQAELVDLTGWFLS